MFIIDGPYVSEFLKKTVYKYQIPVVKTQYALESLDNAKAKFVDEKAAVSILMEDHKAQLYTNSENTLEWIYARLPQHRLAEKSQIVKDKVEFRRALEQLHPDFYYRGVDMDQLQTLKPESIPFPVILKPSIGFFSLGVHKIVDAHGWSQTIDELQQAQSSIKGLYPSQVLDSSLFIIEEVIKGAEFAIDCYFDDNGSVVILNIMKHLFASESDVNDRVYISSNEIMRQYRHSIQDYLQTLGAELQLQSFPAHIEVRIDKEGSINAIEINPLRFGGWCSSPDIAHYAWGINVYEYVEKKIKPNWEELIENQDDRVVALVVLNNSTGVAGDKIVSFNYDSLLEQVTSPLELRKTDYKEYPLFGFLMCEVSEDNLSELYTLLHSDLNEFINLK